MISQVDFQALLDQKGTLVIDGALATELEARGHDLNHALWSAKVLKESPDSIRKIHYDYFANGADIAITASYQASVPGLIKHFNDSKEEALDLIRLSATLAREAALQIEDGRVLLVAGSVGPYGAFLADGSEYRGDYKTPKSELKDFHRTRIQALIDADVDLLAIETMPQLREIEAVLELLKEEFPDAIAWLGCTIRDTGHLSDGTPFDALIDAIKPHHNRLVAVGINCVSIGVVSDALVHMHELSPRIPLLCYPNSGETYDPITKSWGCAPSEYSDLSKLATEWKKAGASLIGGCCRTTPVDINKISSTFR